MAIETRHRPAEFIVNGRGEFPHDMLRHDECWPASAVDATLIGSTGNRHIHLRTWNERGITPARWDSFGWFVTRQPEG